MCHPAVIPMLASAGSSIAAGAAATGTAIAAGAAATGTAIASGAAAIGSAVVSGAGAVGSFLGVGGAGAGASAVGGGAASSGVGAFLSGGPGGLGTALSTSASSGGLIGGSGAGGGILAALKAPGGVGKALEFAGTASSLLSGASNASANAALARFNAQQHKFTIRDAKRAQDLEAVAFGTEARLRRSRIRATAAARGLDPNSSGVAGNVLAEDQRATDRTRNLMRERAAMELYQLKLRKRIGIYEAEVAAQEQASATRSSLFKFAAQQAGPGSFLSSL